MKTPITYWGGKQRLVTTILPLIPEHELYCEPYVGGAAIFISHPRSKTEIINDLDSMVSIFYKVMQSDFENLKEKIDQTLYCRATHKVAMTIREMKHLFSDLQIAWAFFVLTALGFSGTLDSFGCYSKGGKAHTFEKKKTLFTKELKHRFEGVQIENTDAVKLIKLRDTPESFFYLDPPYIDTVQSHYRGYTREMYTELLDVLKNLKGRFLLSSFPSDILHKYIGENGWHSKQINQSKPASRNPDGSKKRKTEVLTANYPLDLL